MLKMTGIIEGIIGNQPFAFKTIYLVKYCSIEKGVNSSSLKAGSILNSI
jgi:hypothetical protein